MRQQRQAARYRTWHDPSVLSFEPQQRNRGRLRVPVFLLFVMIRNDQSAGHVSALGCPQSRFPTGRIRPMGGCARAVARQPKASLAAPPVTATADTRARRALPAAFEASVLMRSNATRGGSNHHRRVEAGWAAARGAPVAQSAKRAARPCPRRWVDAHGRAGFSRFDDAICATSKPRAQRLIPLRKRSVANSDFVIMLGCSIR